MKRVTGIGGIFFKCDDPEKMKEWYRVHLGIDSSGEGAVFRWRDIEDPEKQCITVWSTFPAGTKYFDPSQRPFMVNYRVENLEDLLNELRKEGVAVAGEIEKYEYGKFAWILDPEGNKIELWEAIDDKPV
jgi:predicted enzyme related to lactoylglutathione lyase